MKKSVLQDWVCELSYMQQGVLVAAVRGPDTIRKDHVAKLILRWYRRCILVCAFDGETITNPYDRRGGSFTGPSVGDPEGGWNLEDSIEYWQTVMDEKLRDYLHACDEIPHHFHLHLMHAAEILGYKHPVKHIRAWWCKTYFRMVNDMHLYPELEAHMDMRLGDNESQWRAAEEVTADNPA